jgi:hypothetical protein
VAEAATPVEADLDLDSTRVCYAIVRDNPPWRTLHAFASCENKFTFFA